MIFFAFESVDPEIYSVLGNMNFFDAGGHKIYSFLWGQYLKSKIWGSDDRSHGDTVRCLLLPKHVCARIYISTLDLNLFPRAFNPGRLWRTSVRLPYSQ